MPNLHEIEIIYYIPELDDVSSDSSTLSDSAYQVKDFFVNKYYCLCNLFYKYEYDVAIQYGVDRKWCVIVEMLKCVLKRLFKKAMWQHFISHGFLKLSQMI